MIPETIFLASSPFKIPSCLYGRLCGDSRHRLATEQLCLAGPRLSVEYSLSRAVWHLHDTQGGGDRGITIGLGMTTEVRGWRVTEGTVHTPHLDLLQQPSARLSNFIEVETEAQTGRILSLRLAWSQSKIQDEH